MDPKSSEDVGLAQPLAKAQEQNLLAALKAVARRAQIYTADRGTAVLYSRLERISMRTQSKRTALALDVICMRVLAPHVPFTR